MNENENYFLNDSSLRKHCGLDVIYIHSLKPYSVSICVRLRIQNHTFDGRTQYATSWICPCISIDKIYISVTNDMYLGTVCLVNQIEYCMYAVFFQLGVLLFHEI